MKSYYFKLDYFRHWIKLETHIKEQFKTWIIDSLIFVNNILLRVKQLS